MKRLCIVAAAALGGCYPFTPHALPPVTTPASRTVLPPTPVPAPVSADTPPPAPPA